MTGEPVPRAAWSAPERQIFRPPVPRCWRSPAAAGPTRRAGSRSCPGAALRGGRVPARGDGRALVVTDGRPASGALYALDPYSKHYVALLLSEVLAGTLLLACAYAFTCAWRAGSARWWLAAGAAAGALTLTRWSSCWCRSCSSPPACCTRTPARGPGAATAAAVLLVPWVAWTWSVANEPLLASYGEGYNLLLAAHGEVSKTQTDVLADSAFVRDVEASHESAPGAAAARRPESASALRRPRRPDDAGVRSTSGERLSSEPLQVAWEVVYRAFFLWNAHEDWYQPDGVALLGLRMIDWLFLVAAVVGAGIALVRACAPHGPSSCSCSCTRSRWRPTTWRRGSRCRSVASTLRSSRLLQPQSSRRRIARTRPSRSYRRQARTIERGRPGPARTRPRTAHGRSRQRSGRRARKTRSARSGARDRIDRSAAPSRQAFSGAAR